MTTPAGWLIFLRCTGNTSLLRSHNLSARPWRSNKCCNIVCNTQQHWAHSYIIMHTTSIQIQNKTLSEILQWVWGKRAQHNTTHGHSSVSSLWKRSINSILLLLCSKREAKLNNKHVDKSLTERFCLRRSGVFARGHGYFRGRRGSGKRVRGWGGVVVI